MTYKEIHDLIKLIDKYELAEFQMREGEFEISVKTSKFNKETQAQSVPAPAAGSGVQAVPSAAPQVPENASDTKEAQGEKEATREEVEKENLLEVKSPMVGTFYRSSAPDKPPYVKVGDSIDQGTVVCIIEAMKLFNEIESEVSGTIVKVMVEDASPVEYDQVLFMVDPGK